MCARSGSWTIGDMCPWMAWSGQSAPMEELLFNTRRPLMGRPPGALRSEPGGFGLGWYGSEGEPEVYRGLSATWDDEELRRIAAETESAVFLAHIRSGSDAAVDEADTHPFQHGRWLFVHNGQLGGFETVRDELTRAIDPAIVSNVRGSTDSEVLFHLALTFGLEDDPVGGLERAVGYVETVAASHGVDRAVQASMGLSDGESIWAVRYSTRGSSPTLYSSGDIHAVQMLYPDNPRLQRLREGDHIIVSEPLANLAGAWDPVAEGTVVVLRDGRASKRLFEPAAGA
jgi:predicted glutamine amidotransferase